MDLLLDTNAFLWWEMKVPYLSDGSRGIIAKHNNNVCVSVLAIWEIGLKRSKGKLKINGSIQKSIQANDFELLSITPDDAERFETLPRHHRDPFDRMLIAQALERGLTIMTSDRLFKNYNVPILLI